MEMPIPGFDVNHFVGELLAYAQEKYPAWESKTESDVEDFIQNRYSDAEGLDDAAEMFFIDYGVNLGLSPNAYFEGGEYRLAWANAQVNQNYAFSVEDALEAYDAEVGEIGGHYAHYLAKGAALGVNPSNAFDESDYLQSLIDGYGFEGVTVADLRALAIESGLTPLDFYVDYPEFQAAYPAIPVGGGEVVDVIVTPPQNNAGQEFTLTTAADAIPGLMGSKGTADTSGDDTIVATDTTLTAGDILNGGEGNNVMRVFQNNNGGHDYAAIEVKNVQEIDVTADAGPADLDLSGTQDLELMKSTNSDNDVTFRQVTTLADLFLNNTTEAPNVIVEYQDQVVDGDADAIDVTIEDSSIGILTIGNEDDGNGDIETINLKNFGDDSSVARLNTDLETLNVKGSGDIVVSEYLNGTERLVDASDFTGDLTLAVGRNRASGESVAETVDIVVNEGIGDDTLWVAGGRVDVDMAAGDDRLIFDDDVNATHNHGFRADDALDGGEGVDTLQIGAWLENNTVRDTMDGQYDLSTTEFNNKASFEVIDVRALAVDLTLSQEFVDSVDAGSTLTIHTDMVDTDAGVDAEEVAEAAMVTELDVTQLDQNTPLQYVGGAGSDRLLLDNDTFNDNMILDGGASTNDAAAQATDGDYDTLSVMGSSSKTVIDASDLSNIDNFEGLNLVKSSNTASNVVFNVELTEEFLMNNTEATDDTVNTSSEDTVFQIFSADIEGGATLTRGDTVNIDISDLFNSDGSVKDSIDARGFDFSDLDATGAQINYLINQTPATAGQINDITNENDATITGEADVILSRINPVDLPDLDNILTTEAPGFNTSSGFMIEENRLASSGDDFLYAQAAHLDRTATINMGAGHDIMHIVDRVGGAAGVNDALAASVGVNEVWLDNGSTARVDGKADQHVFAAHAATFSVSGTGVATGSNEDDTIFADIAAGSTIDAGAGNDTINAGAGRDIITAGEGNDFVIAGIMSLNGDEIDLSAGGDNTVAFLAYADGAANRTTLTLGDGKDSIFFNNFFQSDGDRSHLDISNFDVTNDRFELAVTGNDMDGIYYGERLDYDGTILSQGSIIEVNGDETVNGHYQYVNVYNTTALQNHLDGVMHIEAAAGSQSVVIAYGSEGDAAIYTVAETDGANGAYDSIELIAIVRDIGINNFVSADFNIA